MPITKSIGYNMLIGMVITILAYATTKSPDITMAVGVMWVLCSFSQSIILVGQIIGKHGQ